MYKNETKIKEYLRDFNILYVGMSSTGSLVVAQEVDLPFTLFLLSQVIYLTLFECDQNQNINWTDVLTLCRVTWHKQHHIFLIHIDLHCVDIFRLTNTCLTKFLMWCWFTLNLLQIIKLTILQSFYSQINFIYTAQYHKFTLCSGGPAQRALVKREGRRRVRQRGTHSLDSSCVWRNKHTEG